jgi:hypothetical protein
MKPLAKLMHSSARSGPSASRVKDSTLLVEGGSLPRPILRPAEGARLPPLRRGSRRYCRALGETAQATQDRGDDGPDDGGSLPLTSLAEDIARLEAESRRARTRRR